MDPDDPAIKPPRTLRTILAAAPTRTLAAAGVLGLMWGPILAGVVDVANRMQSEQLADMEADLLAPFPLERADPMANGQRPVRRPADDKPISLAVSVSPSHMTDGTDPVDRLRAMTRFHDLSN